MALTLLLVEFTCTLTDNSGEVALSWDGDGSTHTYEVYLKQAGVPIYSFTGTLLNAYEFPSVAGGVYDASVYTASLGTSNTITVDVDCTPSAFSISESHVNPTTIGGSDGTIDISAGGGYIPYTYAWDDGPTTQDRSGLPAGSYHVVATSADSQTDDLTIVLTDPNPCDLTITDIAITKESLRRNNDAYITVGTSTSNVGTIEYSLDNVNWQTSNVLGGLAEGEYTLYVRQYACTDNQAFIITRRNPLYWVQFDDRSGNIIRAELLEANYTGDGERIFASSNPVSIKWQGEGDERYEPIKGSECTVTFESDIDFKFITVFSADNRKYRIDVYKGVEGEALHLDWTGYVLPEIYSEPYRMPPYFVQLKAVDGLGMLKYTPFGLQGSSVSQFSIISYIIQTLDLHIPLISSLDIYESQMLTTIDDEPLQQANVNTAVYVKNKKKLNCQDVLKANLLIYYAKIFQTKGTIRIVRHDQLRGIYGQRIYDKNGTFLLSRYINPVVDIETPNSGNYNPIFINDNATLAIKTAFKSIKTILTYGTETNLVTDGDFLPSAFSDAHNLINWTDTANIEQREAYPGVYSVAILDNGTTPGFKITSKPVFLYEGNGNSISIRFDYFVKASVLGSTTPEVPYQIKIGTQYWTGSAWTSTPTIINETAQVNITSRTKYDLIPVPEDGEFTISLYAVIPHDFTVEEIQYSNVVGKFLPLGAAPPDSATYEVSQSIPYTFTPDDIDVYHGDTPSPVFASAITIQQVGSPTIVQSIEWARSTVSEAKKLLQILVESIAAGYEIPTQKLTADLRGNYHFGMAFRHVFNSNRIFIPTGLNYDARSSIWSGEWLEALEVQPAVGETPVEDAYVVAENGELTEYQLYGTSTLRVVFKDTAGDSTINGLTFVADTTFHTVGSHFTFDTATAIAGTLFDEAYQKEVFDENTWVFTGLANGAYGLYLHFSENYYTAATQRQFHVDVDGVRLLTDLDIYDEAGDDFTALVKKFDIIVSGGQFTLAIVNGSVANPKIDALELLPINEISGIPLG